MSLFERVFPDGSRMDVLHEKNWNGYDIFLRVNGQRSLVAQIRFTDGIWYDRMALHHGKRIWENYSHLNWELKTGCSEETSHLYQVFIYDSIKFVEVFEVMSL